MSDKCKLNTGQWIFHWQRFRLRSNRCRYSKFSTIFDGLLENRKEIFLSLWKICYIIGLSEKFIARFKKNFKATYFC